MKEDDLTLPSGGHPCEGCHRCRLMKTLIMKCFLYSIQKSVAHCTWALLLLITIACRALSADLTIAWDPNSEPDVSAYGIYIRKGAEGPPFDFLGYIELNEIDPDSPSFVVTGLEEGGEYYLVVTALDTEGLESVYSNSACARIEGTVQPCIDSGGGGTPPTGDGTPPTGGDSPPTGDGRSGGGDSSGSGGGGGGGCFIGVLQEIWD